MYVELKQHRVVQIHVCTFNTVAVKFQVWSRRKRSEYVGVYCEGSTCRQVNTKPRQVQKDKKFESVYFKYVHDPHI